MLEGKRRKFVVVAVAIAAVFLVVVAVAIATTTGGDSGDEGRTYTTGQIERLYAELPKVESVQCRSIDAGKAVQRWRCRVHVTDQRIVGRVTIRTLADGTIRSSSVGAPTITVVGE